MRAFDEANPTSYAFSLNRGLTQHQCHDILNHTVPFLGTAIISSANMWSTLLPLLPLILAVSSASTSSLSHTTTLHYTPISNPPSNPHPLATISYDPVTSQTSLDTWTPPKVPEQQDHTSSASNLPLIKILSESGSSTLTSLAIFNNLTSSDGAAAGIIINLTLSPDFTVHSAHLTTSPSTSSSPDSTAAKPISKLTKSGKPKSQARLEREAREAARDAKLAEKARSRSLKKSSSTLPAAGASSPPSPPKPTTQNASKFGNIQINLQTPVTGPAPKLAPPRQPRLAADGTVIPPGQPGSQEAEEEKVEKNFFQKYWWVFLVITVLALGGSGEK